MRFRFGAKPLESTEFDSLAGRMYALPRMSNNPADRWFIGAGSIFYSTSSRVIFGQRLYNLVTDNQRLALAAHELVHIRERDARYASRHVTIPAVTGFLTFFLISYAFWHLLLASLLVSLFGWIFLLLIFLASIGSWRKKIELRCDVIAATFVDGQDLIAGLRIQDSLIPRNRKRGFSYRLATKMTPYPSLGEREEAINHVTTKNGLG